MELGDGGAIENLDFGFQIGQAFKISGTVLDPGRASRSGDPDFYLIPLNSSGSKPPEAPRMAQNQGQGRTSGTFEIRGVRQGRYILYAEDWQVAPNMRDNFVVSQAILDVASDITDLSLVMSGTSVVEGVVLRNAEQKVASNVRVVLIPAEEQRGHPMFYKEVKSDSSGKFTIKGAMPGEYRLFAINPEDFKDAPPPSSPFALPAFLEAYSIQGAVVRAAPEARVNVSVSPIRKTQ